jgi:large subunit ribosomal protein L29
MSTKAIRELSNAEIEKKLRETREAHVNLRVRKQIGQVEQSHELGKLRKDIARLETILKEKKLAAVSA